MSYTDGIDGHRGANASSLNRAPRPPHSGSRGAAADNPSSHRSTLRLTVQTEAGAEEHFDGVSGEPCDDLWQVEADTAIHDQVVAAGRTSRG